MGGACAGSVAESRGRRVETPRRGWRAAALLTVLLGLVAAQVERGGAQQPLQPVLDPAPVPGAGPQRVTAGPEYEAGGLRRFFMGDGYRDLWTAQITVPVLDLRRTAHGLRPIRVGGGLQTQTIHLRGGDDGYYLFRSINKAVRKGLPPDVQGTPAGWIVQEHTNALHPAGEWVVAPLLEAVGIPHTIPRLYVMPDDPILGEYRDEFRGILGMLVESPDKGESGKKRFLGSDDIAGSEDLLERLEANTSERVDSRSLLTARLIDMVVGDSDRHFDNYRWIAFDSAGRRRWVGVPMDRDPAFLRGDGFLATVAQKWFLPKLVTYTDEYDDVDGLWLSQPEIDRLLLAELDRPTWDSTVAFIRSRLTDRVIDDAVRQLPDEYEPLNADFLRESLRSRRDRLPWASDRFYQALAREVDVQATNEDDVAEIVRSPDGTVLVSLFGECAAQASPRRNGAQSQRGGRDARAVCAEPYFQRRIVPGETREVRVYLRGGDDRATVRGQGPQLVLVRVMGGEGNDVLDDASGRAGSPSRTVLYDHEGDNRFSGGDDTPIVRSPWNGRAVTDFVGSSEEKDSTFRDHGSEKHWIPMAGHDASAGVILGVRRQSTTFGFRRDPWATRTDVSVLVGVGGGIGGDVSLRSRVESSPLVLAMHARATRGIGSYRFFGYGNDTPLTDTHAALVPTDELQVDGGVMLSFGDAGEAFLGPVVRYLRSDPDPAGALAGSGLPGSDGYGQVGVTSAIDVRAVDDPAFPRSGVALQGSASAYATAWTANEPLGGFAPALTSKDWFGSAEGELRAYLPLPFRSTLASRVGGAVALGDFPVHEAAFLGGRSDLRGHATDRYAGDGSLFGSTELRLPLGRLTLLTRGTLGTLVFADAGRVYVDGDSPGGWHTAWGGGLWYSTMGVSGALVYGVGEQNRLHAYFGLPF